MNQLRQYLQQGLARLKPQSNSKHEIQNSMLLCEVSLRYEAREQILNPNIEIQNSSATRLGGASGEAWVWIYSLFRILNFGHLDLFRASRFGFKIYVMAAMLIGLCGCGGREAKKTAVNETVPVRCMRVETRDLKRTLDYASSIKAQDDALVYPKVTGKIIEKLKEDGAAVNKGDIIAYIDRDEIGFKFEKSPVDSPLTGIIGSVYVDKGDSVTPQTAVAFVVNLDNVRVSLDVPEKYLPIMILGQSADISVDAFPGQTFTGKVSKISPIVDLQTRTAPIEIFIPNPGHKLMPGMFARVKLVLEEKKQIKLIPKEAVIGNEPEAILFVVEGNIAHQRKVKPGIRDGGEIEIVEGLNAGDLVVIMGQQRLRDGTEVLAEEENLTERN